MPMSATGCHKVRNMSHKLKKHSFSLIEMIAVIAIGMILLGVVTAGTRRAPVFLSLDTSARQIGNLLVTASRQASATGVDMTVVYDGDTRIFRVVAASSSADAAVVPEYSSSLQKQFMAYLLPDSIEVEFPELENDDKSAKFVLFPDGTGSGPETVLKLRGKSVKLHLSPLTGSVIIENPDAQAEATHAQSS